MIRFHKSRSTIFLFFAFSVNASDNLHFLIKSYQWDVIEEMFRHKSPARESEVYSLINYHEKAPGGDSEKRFLFLISQIKGSFVSNYNREDIDKILQNALPHQSVVFRLSFWKLYQELEKRRILSSEEKAIFLAKLSFEMDPVSRRVFEELTKVLTENNSTAELIKRVDSLSNEEKKYYIKTEIWIRYAKAIAREGDLGRARDEYVKLTQDPETPDYIRTFAYQDLKKYLSEDSFLNLRVSNILGFINQMSGEEANSFLRKNKQEFRSRMDNSVSFYEAGRFLSMIDDVDTLISLVQSNRNHVNEDQEKFVRFGDVLLSKNKHQSAIRLMEKFPEINDAGRFRVLMLAYEKSGNREKSIDNLIRYLAAYPFNLHYQDKLIDLLIQKNGSSTKYAENIYWKKAMDEMPDLPVKGRLVYWYFRYLKANNRNDELKSQLQTYYSKIAGSYYTRVIREEFESELNEIPDPPNPTANRDSLFRYLSKTAGVPELSGKILKKNLGFAYFDKSFDLGVKLTNIQSKIKGERLLATAADYFRLGEESFGMNLVNYYARDRNLSILEKEEILVGIGDLSQNTYFSAFYTRSLLKRYKIPDDPILLPTSIASRIYPRPHREMVVKHSRDAGISEDVVYAIMRQESFYKENAISRSNAQGLMQIMPATGRELARNLRVTNYSLFNPNTSIQFGSRFLAYLMKENQNDMRWASIAYNGGPGNLRKWKRNHYTGDFNHFLEDVPYKESRDYCRITVSNYYAYDIMKKYHGL
ncbi:lytic transglycosylase domain-containing protein [Leptospira sp. GIMC2001]|uniref:lytic transglycosylase domain-containing protein n=1 Tax=Leptospira sp. GIMC2001 TaxID=1513297 RepID=UPI00234949B3|nr:lytic transglycosylase domain-containing protein [Leptospira sp. GIMC2001]WCL50516.1 lytic transglycosylase domain-containing protein [Leptospira sp. GIMC2001]